MRTDWQGSKAQNIGARAGGPPSRSFLTNCGVAALLWKICIPRFGRLARFQPQPQVAAAGAGAAHSSAGQDQSINHFSQSAWGGWGMGGGGGWRRPEGGSEGLGVLRGASGLYGLDWTGLAQRAAAAGAGPGTQAQADVHVSAKNLVPPMRHPSTLHPAPRSSGQPLLLLPLQPRSQPDHTLGAPPYYQDPGSIHPPCSLPKSTSDSHTHTLDQHHHSRQTDHVFPFLGSVCTIVYIALRFLIPSGIVNAIFFGAQKPTFCR